MATLTGNPRVHLPRAALYHLHSLIAPLGTIRSPPPAPVFYYRTAPCPTPLSGLWCGARSARSSSRAVRGPAPCMHARVRVGGSAGAPIQPSPRFSPGPNPVDPARSSAAAKRQIRGNVCTNLSFNRPAKQLAATQLEAENQSGGVLRHLYLTLSSFTDGHLMPSTTQSCSFPIPSPTSSCSLSPISLTTLALSLSLWPLISLLL